MNDEAIDGVIAAILQHWQPSERKLDLAAALSEVDPQRKDALVEALLDPVVMEACDNDLGGIARIELPAFEHFADLAGAVSAIARFKQLHSLRLRFSRRNAGNVLLLDEFDATPRPTPLDVTIDCACDAEGLIVLPAAVEVHLHTTAPAEVPGVRVVQEGRRSFVLGERAPSTAAFG